MFWKSYCPCLKFNCHRKLSIVERINFNFMCWSSDFSLPQEMQLKHMQCHLVAICLYLIFSYTSIDLSRKHRFLNRPTWKIYHRRRFFVNSIVEHFFKIICLTYIISNDLYNPWMWFHLRRVFHLWTSLSLQELVRKGVS